MSRTAFTVHRVLLALVLLTGPCCVPEYMGQTPKVKILSPGTKRYAPEIHFVVQDSTGFLWTATSAGLMKYDGMVSTMIAPIEDGERISSLKMQGNQVITGYSTGKLSVFDATTSKLVRGWKLGNSPISDMVILPDSSLWVATYGEGIYSISPKGTGHYTTTNGLGDDMTYCIVHPAGTNKLLVGTDLGLSIFSFDQPETIFTLDMDRGLPDNLVTALLPLDGGNILVGTESGILCNYNIEARRFNSLACFDNVGPASRISQIIQADDDIWLATEHTGLMVMNWPQADDLQQLIPPQWDPLPSYTSILADREGNVIAAAGKADLLVIDTRLLFVTEHEGTDFRGVSALMCDRQGNIWFAGKDGLYEHSANFIEKSTVHTILKGLEKKNIRIISLYEDASGIVWFGTFDHGVGRYDENTGKIRWYTEKDGLVNNNVLSITGNETGTWFATLGGASWLSNETVPVFTSFDQKSALKSSYVYCVMCDADGNIWIGTDGNGPAKWTGTQFEFLQDKLPEVGRNVSAITQDHLGTFWFYSADRGLQHLSGDSLSPVDFGSIDETIEVFNMTGDSDGQLLAFTSSGILLIDPENHKPQLLEENVQYSTDYLNIMSADVQGQMWIGSNEGMLRYRETNPGKATRPKTVLTGVLNFLQTIDTTGSHTFHFKENHLAFEYAGLWFQDPERVSYQYRMEGFSDSWVNTRDRMAIFPHLPPGTYTFQVRAAAGDAFEGSTEASYTFTIQSPYWQRRFFWVAIVVCGILVLYLLLRLRIRSLKRHEQLQRDRIQSQFETLRNQVNPHFLFNSLNTLVSMITKDKDSSIEFVEKLADYFRIILAQRDKDFITVREEMELAGHYLYLQKKRFGDNFNFHIEITEDDQESLIPPMTFQMLAENAVKHNSISRSSPLDIRFESEGDYIVVSNNINEKLAQEPGTGVGLQNIRNRYRILFNKEIQVAKAENLFLVRLPVIRT